MGTQQHVTPAMGPSSICTICRRRRRQYGVLGYMSIRTEQIALSIPSSQGLTVAQPAQLHGVCTYRHPADQSTCICISSWQVYLPANSTDVAFFSCELCPISSVVNAEASCQMLQDAVRPFRAIGNFTLMFSNAPRVLSTMLPAVDG
jgi:hypothetical protein